MGTSISKILEDKEKIQLEEWPAVQVLTLLRTCALAGGKGASLPAGDFLEVKEHSEEHAFLIGTLTSPDPYLLYLALTPLEALLLCLHHSKASYQAARD